MKLIQIYILLGSIVLCNGVQVPQNLINVRMVEPLVKTLGSKQISTQNGASMTQEQSSGCKWLKSAERSDLLVQIVLRTIYFSNEQRKPLAMKFIPVDFNRTMMGQVINIPKNKFKDINETMIMFFARVRHILANLQDHSKTVAILKALKTKQKC